MDEIEQLDELMDGVEEYFSEWIKDFDACIKHAQESRSHAQGEKEKARALSRYQDAVEIRSNIRSLYFERLEEIDNQREVLIKRLTRENKKPDAYANLIAAAKATLKNSEEDGITITDKRFHEVLDELKAAVDLATKTSS